MEMATWRGAQLSASALPVDRDGYRTYLDDAKGGHGVRSKDTRVRTVAEGACSRIAVRIGFTRVADALGELGQPHLLELHRASSSLVAAFDATCAHDAAQRQPQRALSGLSSNPHHGPRCGAQKLDAGVDSAAVPPTKPLMGLTATATPACAAPFVDGGVGCAPAQRRALGAVNANQEQHGPLAKMRRTADGRVWA
jgi:hypothetical protein